MDKSQDLVIKSNSSKLGNWPLLTHSGKKKIRKPKHRRDPAYENMQTPIIETACNAQKHD